MSESDLRAALDVANVRLHQAMRALASKHKGGEVAEYEAAHEAVLVAERALATARGEAYAVPIEFPVLPRTNVEDTLPRSPGEGREGAF